MRGRRHAVRRRAQPWLRLGVFVLVGTLVLGSGGAYGAYRYEQGQTGRILPGVRIAGVDVGEMSRGEAIAALEARAEEELSREIEVRVRGRSWHVTPAELGTAADVAGKVDRALALGEGMAWHERAVHRIFDRPVRERFGLRFSRDGKMLKRFLDVVEEAVYVSPRDAAVDLVDGEIVVQRPEAGVALDIERARKALRAAMREDEPEVVLPVSRVAPEVTMDDLGKTIVVRLSENRLYVYEGARVVKTYDVATGTPQYPTPQGTWNIWDKRENPVWVNPAPNGWGAGLPATIGPGPDNPLGTHALYLDAPGIRIHGTYAESSIGSYASHGCIRMHIADSKELFSMIPIGTQVHVLP